MLAVIKVEVNFWVAVAHLLPGQASGNDQSSQLPGQPQIGVGHLLLMLRTVLLRPGHKSYQLGTGTSDIVVDFPGGYLDGFRSWKGMGQLLQYHIVISAIGNIEPNFRLAAVPG